jgi:pimeloyl-ACP methyl ester carboxylesterase
MVEYLGIAGTNSNRMMQDWDHLGSGFTRYLLKHGFVSVEERASIGFDWSDDIDLGRGHEDWKAGGRAVFYYLVPPLYPTPPCATNIIAHSHGGQVALYAAAYGLKINCLITVGTPVREDMQEIIAVARPNIQRWLHLRSNNDMWQWFGSWFDGGLKLNRDFKQADLNATMPKGHANILRDEELFPLWLSEGWLPFLAGVGPYISETKSSS